MFGGNWLKIFINKSRATLHKLSQGKVHRVILIAVKIFTILNNENRQFSQSVELGSEPVVEIFGIN